jgi:hypothetical protein
MTSARIEREDRDLVFLAADRDAEEAAATVEHERRAAALYGGFTGSADCVSSLRIVPCS